MVRILVIGASGQIGSELVVALRRSGLVVAAARKPGESNSLTVDLASPGSVRRLVRDVRPDLIVNAAAYTSVDKAEEQEQVATAINGVAPGILAEEAKAAKAALIHYSTDYVFDGSKAQPYKEDDVTNPLCAYGRSKLAGEQAVTASGAAYLIFRTSWIYGARGNNFFLTIRSLARERSELHVVDDQIGAPTWSRLVAHTTARIVEQGSINVAEYIRERSGVYHMSCAGQTSWFGFAREIISSMVVADVHPLAKVIPISTNEYKRPAKRPAWSVLDNSRLAEMFMVRLPDWREAANTLFKEFIDS